MKILLAITGSIAAYKACSIVSVLESKGHEIQCVMTDNAKKFVTPMTFSALSHRPVLTNDDEWSCTDGKIPHIYYTQEWADMFVIAPSTINMMAKIGNLIADDIVSNMALALPIDIKKIIFPAANTRMYEKCVSLRDELKHRGWIVGGTQFKKLACGITGKGALEKTSIIIETIENEQQL